jgi:hypothetical protein
MWYFLIFQLAFGAGWGALGALVRTFSMAVTTPSTQAARRLPAVDPDVTRPLAILTLVQTTFRLISL